MSGTEVVEIRPPSAVACSRRLLSAIRSESLPALRRELDRAQQVLNSPLPPAGWSSLAEEQIELLDAIVERMRTSLDRCDPCAKAEVFLLSHL